MKISNSTVWTQYQKTKPFSLKLFFFYSFEEKVLVVSWLNEARWHEIATSSRYICIKFISFFHYQFKSTRNKYNNRSENKWKCWKVSHVLFLFTFLFVIHSFEYACVSLFFFFPIQFQIILCFLLLWCAE